MCHEAERWKLTLRRHWLEEFGDRCRAGLEMKNRRPAPRGGNLRLILCCRSETDGSSQGGHVGGLRPKREVIGSSADPDGIRDRTSTASSGRCSRADLRDRLRRFHWEELSREQGR